jgi:hypothetical protein
VKVSKPARDAAEVGRDGSAAMAAMAANRLHSISSSPCALAAGWVDRRASRFGANFAWHNNAASQALCRLPKIWTSMMVRARSI